MRNCVLGTLLCLVSCTVLVSAQICSPSLVSLIFNGPVSCGSSFNATLSHNGTNTCSFSSGGALLCDSDGRNCGSCAVSPGTSVRSLIYQCAGIPYSGRQTLTGTYLIGSTITTISNSTNVGTCGPSTPNAPISAPSGTAPTPCDHDSVEFYVIPPLQTSTPFSAILNATTARCTLSSGGALLCRLGDCLSCSVSQLSSSSLRYNCMGPPNSLPCQLTGTYQLGSSISTKTLNGLVFNDSYIPSTVPAPLDPIPAPLAPIHVPIAPIAPPIVIPPAPLASNPSTAPTDSEVPGFSTEPFYVPPIYGPFAPPVAPPPAPPSALGCDISTVRLVVYPPLIVNTPFTASLSTTGVCSISSGGALICNTTRCEQCPVTQLNPKALRYNCIGLPTVGVQDITAVYLLGDIYSRITIKTLIFSPQSPTSA